MCKSLKGKDIPQFPIILFPYIFNQCLKISVIKMEISLLPRKSQMNA